jgi:hypothetical protein
MTRQANYSPELGNPYRPELKSSHTDGVTDRWANPFVRLLLSLGRDVTRGLNGMSRHSRDREIRPVYTFIGVDIIPGSNRVDIHYFTQFINPLEIR